MRWLRLLEQLPSEVRYVLGDTHYNDPELRRQCQQRGWELVATRRGPHPHAMAGWQVRQVFHKLRSQAIEPFNGLFKNVFEWRGDDARQGLAAVAVAGPGGRRRLSIGLALST